MLVHFHLTTTFTRISASIYASEYSALTFTSYKLWGGRKCFVLLPRLVQDLFLGNKGAPTCFITARAYFLLCLRVSFLVLRFTLIHCVSPLGANYTIEIIFYSTFCYQLNPLYNILARNIEPIASFAFPTWHKLFVSLSYANCHWYGVLCIRFLTPGKQFLCT